MVIQRKGLLTHMQIVSAKENVKLSYGGPSQRQASYINQQIKDLRQGRH